jgi:class 3 adenylate cyclase
MPSSTSRQLDGERRWATVILADVKGSTALAEKVDVEAWVEIMNRVFQILGDEIYAYDGQIDQFRGDGLVAFFGVPVAHEDDAERAVLAALAMQDAVQGYAAELSDQEGIELLLRVGVNTGEVIAAQVGDSRRHSEDTAMGRAIALAARMESAAEPGTVLVSEQTYRLVAPMFEWQALGEVAAKGFSQPVAVYRPLAHKAISGKGRGIAGLESPLVGRDAELQALREALDRLRTGIGGIATVVGEAGIGKSRLVTEVRRTADREPQAIDRRPTTADGGLAWVEGRCLSYATNVAYHPWLDILHGWLGLAPDASPADVGAMLRERVRVLCGDCVDEVYPYLGRMMALPLEEEVEVRLRGLDAESQRFLTFGAVETALARSAEARPLVVVLEDLHWADPTSLVLLEQLLALTDRVPLLFVCILRPERAHGCWQVVEAAARDYGHYHTDVRLKPLSAAESATLVGNLLHVEALPQELRERILEHAEGNPFYVEEILRSLIDEGIVVHDEITDPSTGLRASTPEHSGVGRASRWRATREVADIPIPDTLHGVIAARIDRLPAEVKRVLQLASVVGRIFTYPVLAAIGAGSPLDAHLVALERAQLIRARARLPEREYAFKHVLTQEAAYGGLLRRERRTAHRRAAEALERLYPERVEEQLGLLAYHWEGAGARERAVGYLRRAGERAAAQFANEEAVEYLSSALALVPEDDLAERYVLLLAREGAYYLQGAREAQAEDLSMLETLAEALDGPQESGRRAQVAVRRGKYAFKLRDYPATIAAAQKAVRLPHRRWPWRWRRQSPPPG